MSAAQPSVTLSRNEAMRRALALHQSGATDQASAIYEAVLRADPRDADALHLLGLVCDARGEAARGVALIHQALAITETTTFRANLGLLLAHLGRHEEALACYRAALDRAPDFFDALGNMGLTLLALRRPAEAEAAFRRAVALRPGDAGAWSNLGEALSRLNRREEAIAAFERAVASDPAAPRAGLARALDAAGRGAEAEANFRADLARQPDNVAALNNLAAHLGQSSEFPPGNPAGLALALQRLGRFEEAAAVSRRALDLQPDSFDALTNLGNALRRLERLDEAEAVLRRALALRPGNIGACNNLAITLMHQARPWEALALLDLAAAIDPDDAETQHHRATVLLRQGRFAAGWAAYEGRLRIAQFGDAYTAFAHRPAWNGAPLEGRTILLLGEQGLGDIVQFCRYAPLVAAAGGRVLLGVHRPLMRLLGSLEGVARVLAADDTLPPFDEHCPLMSLPRIFGTNATNLPDTVPYLHAEPPAIATWRDRIGHSAPGLRVGIVWAGNPRHGNDLNRSIPFAALAPLWRVPGLRWFSLQLGPRAADLRDAPPGSITDLSAGLTDFAETAAAMMALDLVIAVDTAVAHVAGALGRPTWLLLPRIADWRWLAAGEASPWYPTMRLFRQDAAKSWDAVLARVAAALRLDLRQ